MGRKRQRPIFVSTSAGSRGSVHSPPPEVTGDYWPVINMGIDERSFTILSNGWFGLYVHYTQFRTLPCLLDVAGDCEQCGLTSRRWVGYLAVYPSGETQKHLLSLTPTAVTKNKRLMENIDLAGRKLDCWRSPRTKRGRLHCKVSDGKCDPASIRDDVTDKDELEKQVYVLLGLVIEDDKASAFADAAELNFGEI